MRAALSSILGFPRFRGVVFRGLAALLLLLPVTAAADDDAGVADPHARALQLLEQAERDDAAFAFDRALTGYEEALRLDPSMSKAMRAEQRAKMIRARSEGAYEPLATFERVRRDPKLASDPRAIDDLVRAANGFPPGIVRVEAWVLAAEAYANRLNRPDDAVPLWKRIAVDPYAEPAVVRSTVASLADHHLARGDHAGAEAALTLAGPAADEKLSKKVHRVVRRHTLHIASIATIVAALALAAAAVFRAARAGRVRAVIERARASSRLVIGYAAYVAIGGALLASGYEEGTARPFLLFGVVLVPLLLVARAWAAAGSPARSARGLRAALCATSALGAAFLVLEHVDVAYLEGIGL